MQINLNSQALGVGIAAPVTLIGIQMSDAVVKVSSIAALLEFAQTVPMGHIEALKKVLKGASLDSALASFVKNENKSLGLIGGYAAVYRGIVQTLAHGQKSKLIGLGVASKKTSAAFAALVSLGVCSEAGAVLIGVDPLSKGKKSEDTLMGYQMAFVASLWASRAVALETAKAEREAKTAAKTASDTTSDTASDTASDTGTVSPIVGETMGQKQDTAVGFVVAALGAGTLSEESRAMLLEALGVSVAPVAPVAPVARKAKTKTGKTLEAAPI